MELFIKIFYEFDPKDQRGKDKNKWVGLYQTEKVLQSKRNQQQNKGATDQIGHDICKQQLLQRLILKIQNPAEIIPLNVVGRVYECLAPNEQQFECFT